MSFSSKIAVFAPTTIASFFICCLHF